MRKLTLLLGVMLTCLLSITAWAQTETPQGIKYQAIARGPAGNVLDNETISVRFKILNEVDFVEYQEQHTVTTNEFGLFSVTVGEGSAVGGTFFQSIAWRDGSKRMEVLLDVGQGLESMGIMNLVSVPYSLHGMQAEIALREFQTLRLDNNSVTSTAMPELYTLNLSDGLPGDETYSNVQFNIDDFQPLSETLLDGNSANNSILNVTDVDIDHAATTRGYLDMKFFAGASLIGDGSIGNEFKLRFTDGDGNEEQLVDVNKLITVPDFAGEQGIHVSQPGGPNQPVRVRLGYAAGETVSEFTADRTVDIANQTFRIEDNTAGTFQVDVNDVDINTTNDVSVDGNNISIDGTGNSNFSTTAGALTLETTTNASGNDVVINSGDDVLVTVDDGILIRSNNNQVGAGITIESLNNGDLNLNANTGNLDLDGNTVNMNSDAGNVTVTAQNAGNNATIDLQGNVAVTTGTFALTDTPYLADGAVVSQIVTQINFPAPTHYRVVTEEGIVNAFRELAGSGLTFNTATALIDWNGPLTTATVITGNGNGVSITDLTSLELESDNGIDIDASAGDVTIDAVGNVLTSATVSISNTAVTDVNNVAGNDVNLTAGNNVNVTATADVITSAANITNTVTTNISNTAGGNVTNTIAVNETNTVGGDVITSAANITNTVTTNISNTAGGNVTNTVGGNVTNTIAGNETNAVTGDVLTSATNITSEASNDVTITAGNNGEFMTNGTLTLEAGDATNNTIDMQGNVAVTTGTFALNNGAVTTDEIVTFIDNDDDTNLVTEGAVYDFVSGAAGSALTWDAANSEIDLGGAMNVNADIDGVNTHTFTVQNVTALTLESDNGIDVDASNGGIALDATGASNFTTTVGDIAVNAAATVDIDGATGVTIDAAANDVDINAAAATVDIDGATGVTIDAAANDVDINAAAATVDIDGATGVTIDAAANDVDINAATNVDVVAGTNVTVDATATQITAGTFGLNNFATVDVNEIVTVIAATPTFSEDQLVTESAVSNFVANAAGSALTWNAATNQIDLGGDMTEDATITTHNGVGNGNILFNGDGNVEITDNVTATINANTFNIGNSTGDNVNFTAAVDILDGTFTTNNVTEVRMNSNDIHIGDDTGDVILIDGDVRFDGGVGGGSTFGLTNHVDVQVDEIVTVINGADNDQLVTEGAITGLLNGLAGSGLTLNGQTIDLGGPLTIPADIQTAGGGNDLIVSGAGNFNVTNTGALNVSDATTLDIDSDNIFIGNDDADVITINGTVNHTTGTFTTANDVTLNFNSNDINIGGGATDDIDLQGVVQVAAGSFQLTSGAVVDEIVTVIVGADNDQLVTEGAIVGFLGNLAGSGLTFNTGTNRIDLGGALTGAADIQTAGLGADFSVSGTGNTIINTTATFNGQLDVNSPNTVTIDAGAASNFTTTAGALTLDGNGGVNIAGNAAEIDVTTTGDVDMNATNVDVDATDVFIDATNTVNIGSVAGDDIDLNGAVQLEDGTFAMRNLSGAENTTVNEIVSIVNGASEDQLVTESGIVAFVNSSVSMAGSGMTQNGQLIDLGGTLTSDADIDTDGNNFSVSGTGNTIINTTATFNGQFDVNSPNTVTIDAGAASNFTTTAGALTLDGNGGVNIAGNAAEIDVTTTGDVDMNATNVDVDATDVFIDATNTVNIGSVAGDDIDLNGAVQLEDGTFAMRNLSGAENTTVNEIVSIVNGASEDQLVTESGIVAFVNSSVSMAGSGMTQNGQLIDLGGTLTSDADIDTDGNNFSVSGTGNTIINTTATFNGQFDVNSPNTVTIDAGAASNFTTTAGALTLDGNGGVNIAGNAAEIDVTTTGDVDMNATNVDVDATDVFIDATNTVNIGSVAGDDIDLNGAVQLEDGTFAMRNLSGAENTTVNEIVSIVNGASEDQLVTESGIVAFVNSSVSMAGSGMTQNGQLIDLGGTLTSDADIDTDGNNFSVSGTGNTIINTTATFNGQFDVNSPNNVTIDAGAASNFTTTAGALTLDGNGGVNIAGNAAEIDVTTTGDVDMNATNVDVDATDVFIDATNTVNIGSVAGDDIDLNGAVQLEDGTFAMRNLSGAENTTVNEIVSIVNGASEDQLVTESGIVAFVNSSVSMAGSGMTQNGQLIDLGGTLTSDADIDTDGNNFSVSGTGNTIINTTATFNGQFDVNSPNTVTIDAGAASNFTTTAGALTLDGNGGVNIAGNAAEIDVTTTGDVDMNATNVDVDATDVFIDATNTVNIGSVAGDDIDLNGAVQLEDGTFAMRNLSGAENTTVNEIVSIVNGASEDQLVTESGIVAFVNSSVSMAGSGMTQNGQLIDLGGTLTSDADIDTDGNNFSVSGTGNTIINTTATFNGQFDVNSPNTVTIDAGAASNFTTTAGALTLDGNGGVNIAGNAAEIDVTTTGDVDMNATNVDVDATDVFIDATNTVNIGSVAGDDIDLNGAVQLEDGTFAMRNLSGAENTTVNEIVSIVNGASEDQLVTESGIVAFVNSSVSMAGSGMTQNGQLIDLGGTLTSDADIDTDGNNFSVSGTGNTIINTTATFNGQFDVNSPNTVTIDAGAASNFTTTAGALTLDGNGGVNIAGNAAEIDVTTTGDVDMNATNVDVDATDVFIDATNTVNIGSVAGDDIDLNGAVQLEDGTFAMRNLSGAENTTVNEIVSIVNGASEDQLVTESGIVAFVNSSVSMAGSGMTQNGQLIDLGGTLTSDADIDTDGNNFSVSGTGNTIINTTATFNGQFDVNSPNTVTIDAGAASNFTTTAGALTLDGNGGVNIAGNAAEIDVTTTGDVDMNATNVDVDATDVFIDATNTVNIGSVAGDDIDLNGAVQLEDGTFAMRNLSGAENTTVNEIVSIVNGASEDQLVTESGIVAFVNSSVSMAGSGMTQNGQLIDLGGTLTSDADIDTDGNNFSVSGTGNTIINTTATFNGQFDVNSPNNVTIDAAGAGTVNLNAAGGTTNDLTIFDDGRVGIGFTTFPGSLSISTATAQYGIDGASNTTITNGTATLLNPDLTTIYNDVQFAVNGSAFIGGNVISSGALLAQGSVTFSDKRFKKNIETLPNALDNVMKMRGVSYDMDTENFPGFFKDGKQLGVIAQEIEEVYPELIKSAIAGTDYKAVNYEGLIPVLLEAIKEQQKLITEQQAQIASLEASLSGTEDLKAQVATLQEQMTKQQKQMSLLMQVMELQNQTEEAATAEDKK